MENDRPISTVRGSGRNHRVPISRDGNAQESVYDGSGTDLTPELVFGESDNVSSIMAALGTIRQVQVSETGGDSPDAPQETGVLHLRADAQPDPEPVVVPVAPQVTQPETPTRRRFARKIVPTIPTATTVSVKEFAREHSPATQEPDHKKAIVFNVDKILRDSAERRHRAELAAAKVPLPESVVVDDEVVDAEIVDEENKSTEVMRSENNDNNNQGDTMSTTERGFDDQTTSITTADSQDSWTQMQGTVHEGELVDLSHQVGIGAGTELEIVREPKQSFWEKKDLEETQPIQPYSLIPELQDRATAMLDDQMSRFFSDKVVATVLKTLISEESKSVYMNDSPEIQDSKVGIRERFLGERLPNRLQAGRNERLTERARLASSEGFARVVDTRISMDEATHHLFGDALGMRVRPYTIDVEVDGLNENGEKIKVEQELGVLTVNGIKAGKIIEEETQIEAPVIGRPAKKLLARKDLGHGITRKIAGGSTEDGRTYETMFLVTDPTNPSRVLLGGERPLFMQGPGEKPCVISEVAAVALMPNAVYPVQSFFFAAERELDTKREGVGSIVRKAGTLAVNIVELNDWMTNVDAVGSLTEGYKTDWDSEEPVESKALTSGSTDSSIKMTYEDTLAAINGLAY